MDDKIGSKNFSLSVSDLGSALIGSSSAIVLVLIAAITSWWTGQDLTEVFGKHSGLVAACGLVALNMLKEAVQRHDELLTVEGAKRFGWSVAISVFATVSAYVQAMQFDTTVDPISLGLWSMGVNVARKYVFNTQPVVINTTATIVDEDKE